MISTITFAEKENTVSIRDKGTCPANLTRFSTNTMVAIHD
jgi:hypothetical protein